jgi:peptide-methionine (S)-S-oxide reductase
VFCFYGCCASLSHTLAYGNVVCFAFAPTTQIQYTCRPQGRFQRIPGVERCVVGYSGGKERNPTYRAILDHTEALLVEFDPSVVTYHDLVVEWSRMHNPTLPKSRCQYRSAIWYVTAEQQRVADEVVVGLQAGLPGKKLYTSVEPVTRFYKAEEYHQNFMSKQHRGF